jgi:hypothetical protein
MSDQKYLFVGGTNNFWEKTFISSVFIPGYTILFHGEDIYSWVEKLIPVRQIYFREQMYSWVET